MHFGTANLSPWPGHQEHISHTCTDELTAVRLPVDYCYLSLSPLTLAVWVDQATALDGRLMDAKWYRVRAMAPRLPAEGHCQSQSCVCWRLLHSNYTSRRHPLWVEWRRAIVGSVEHVPVRRDKSANRHTTHLLANLRRWACKGWSE